MIEHIEDGLFCARCRCMLEECVTEDGRPHTVCARCRTGRLHTQDGTPHGLSVYVGADPRARQVAA